MNGDACGRLAPESTNRAPRGALSQPAATPCGDVARWTTEEVSAFLVQRGFADAAAHFANHKISGELLYQLTENNLLDIGIRELGVRLQLKALLKELCAPVEVTVPVNGTVMTAHVPTKVFCDPIHGHIKLHPLLVKIVDTVQFQRLRNIRQLGGTYRVFPGASHNRFEHSIGVCHLAGIFIETLRTNQPELGITNVDVLCVQAAGLCHDLGHGPFSHLFDGQFMPSVAPLTNWKHEDGSVKMLDYLIKDNHLTEDFLHYGLNQQDVVFIKELIFGPVDSVDGEEWPYKGREREKGFLYEIVANKRTGIDVDRWDYFARDCHHLGIQNQFDHSRFMEFARVLKVGSDSHISTRDKEAVNVYGMFLTRYMLYYSAYYHVSSMAVELMIAEALKAANDHLLFPGNNGKMCRLSDTVNDMEAFTKITDDVYYRILWSTEASLSKARELLMRIERRKLFALVGQTAPITGGKFDGVKLDEVATNIARLQPEGTELFTSEDLLIKVVCLGFGIKDKHPLEHVYFYSKSNPERALLIPREQVSQVILPQSSQEHYVRVYCRLDDSAAVNAAAAAFARWCSVHSLAGDELALASLHVSPLRPAVKRSNSSRGTADETSSSLSTKARRRVDL